MIKDIFSLYKARKDAGLAKRIASEMIVDGVIDRASWPLAVAKFWLSLAIGVLTALILVFLVIGAFTHWTLAIPVFPLSGLIYGIIRIWRGANAGVERITRLAKQELGNRTAALKMPSLSKKEDMDTLT